MLTYSNTFFMQNYQTMQRKDVTDKPFGVEENSENTRGFKRPFKVLSVIFHLTPALDLCFEHNVLSVSKLKAVFVIFQIVAVNWYFWTFIVNCNQFSDDLFPQDLNIFCQWNPFSNITRKHKYIKQIQMEWL